MKIIPGVNFINILQAAFSNKSLLSSFFVLSTKVCIFWQKEIGAKAARKILVILTAVEYILMKKWVKRKTELSRKWGKWNSLVSSSVIKSVSIIFYFILKCEKNMHYIYYVSIK